MKEWTDAVVRVDGGRGFIMEAGHRRIVVTAAHCLPHFPPAMSETSYTEGRTYANLLAKLGEEPSIRAECTFADPIGDVAVLGCPDGQLLYDEALAYEELTESPAPFRMAGTPEDGEAYVLSLSNEWYGCKVSHHGGPLHIEASQGFAGGMSGSPIVNEAGEAIGIVCSTCCNAHLVMALPGWLLRELSV